MPPKLIKNPKNGNSRISQACDRCRIKKIKCDGQLPSCSNCFKIGFNCKTSDKLTRRSFPKGYTENLEQNLIFLQNENLKLVELIKRGNTKANAGSTDSPDPDLSLLLNGEGSKVDVLVDSLHENHTNSLNAALSKKQAASAAAASPSRQPSRQGAASGACSAQFTTFTVNQANVGKNLVNYSLSNHLNAITSSSGASASSQSGSRAANTFVDNNSLAFILDSVLFKLFLLANNQNNNLIINQQNSVILQKFISNYFDHINDSFLYMTDKVEFTANLAKFKQQLKHLVAQYNVMSGGGSSSSAGSADSHAHEKINENIKINETSICFKIQLLLVIYLGNINYSILYPESSSDSGQSSSSMFKFFKLNYDYEFLKKIILEKLNLVKDAAPSLEVLQIYLLFFYLSLCYENSDGESATAAASAAASSGANTSSIGEKFLVRSTKNSAYLVKISQVINNYLVGVLRLHDGDGEDGANVKEFRSGAGSTEHFMANYLNNLTGQDRRSHHHYRQPSQHGLRVKLYWSTYVLNSFLVLKTGDYFNNSFFRAHYEGTSNSRISELQSLQSQNEAKSLQTMCRLVQLCQYINGFILGCNVDGYDDNNGDDGCYHFCDGEGTLVRVANENSSSGKSALPNWENELWLLSDAKLTTLDQKLASWKQSHDDSNMGILELEAGSGMHNSSNTNQPSLPDIQLNLVYLHLRSLIHLRKAKFGTTLSDPKSTADVDASDKAGEDSVIKFASISREFLSCLISVDYINNDFHGKAGNGNGSFDNTDSISEEPTLKRRKYSTVSTSSASSLLSSSSSNTMLCDYDLGANLGSAVKKSSTISVKSIEQEFISSIMSSGSGSGSGSTSTCSSLPFSLSSLNKNIETYFSTSNNSHTQPGSGFSLSLFFKSMNSILESSAKRRRAHFQQQQQQQQNPNASSTSSSSSSSFKNGFKTIPIDILQTAMFQISTLLAILKNGYYEAQSDLFIQSVKVIIKVLVILIKNYEFDSLSTGNAGSACDGCVFWYKDWFKRIELDLMSLAGLTSAHGGSAASSSPVITMMNKQRSSSMVSKRPSISLSNNTNTGSPSSSPLSSSSYYQQQQHTASPSIFSYHNGHNGGTELSLNTANLATASNNNSNNTSNANNSNNSNNNHNHHNQNNHSRSHRSDSTSTTSTSMSMSMSVPMAHSMSMSTTVPPTASSSIDMSMSMSMPMSLDMSPTSSVNSLFSTSSSSLGHHRNRRDSISTAGSSIGSGSGGSYGSAAGMINSSAGQNPRKRMNSMSVLENGGDASGNGNPVNNILKQSLMMKRNSSSAVARPTMHPNCSLATAFAPVTSSSSSGAAGKSNETGHDDVYANTHENHEFNGHDEQDDDFNLNSLFDWNKVGGAAGSANANANLNGKNSATIDDRRHDDNNNQYLAKESGKDEENDAIIADAGADADAEASAGADASDKNVSINNLVDNLICPKYSMNFFNRNGDDADNNQKGFKEDNVVSDAVAAATAGDDNGSVSGKGQANVDNHNENENAKPLKTKKALFLKASLSPNLPSASTAGKQTHPEVSVVKKVDNDGNDSDNLKNFRLDYDYNHDYDDSDEMASAGTDVNVNDHASTDVNSTGFSKNSSFLNVFQAIEKDFVNASTRDENGHDEHDDGPNDVHMSIDDEASENHDESASTSKQEISLLDMGKKFNDFNLILEH